MSTNVAQKKEGKDTPRSRPLKSTPSRLFRKLTRRFKTPILPPKSANPETASPPRSPTQLSNRRSQAVPIASGDVAAVMRRQAALHQCGLVPLPRKDLSQLEADLDRRFTRIVVLPDDQQDSEEMTTAEKIRKEWQAKNEALPEKQGDDGADPTDPNRFPSESSNAERLEQSDPMGNVEERTTPELTVPPSPDPLVNPESPVPLSPIPETFSIPEVPEEDVAPSENEKETSPTRPLEIVDPLSIPLPDSPSSTNLPDLPPPPPPRESKRLPPIIIGLTTNETQEQEQVARGRSLNRDSPQSVASKPSLPALSPTMTASSSSSLPTPRDDESRERMDTAITWSSGAKPRFSRLGKATHTRHRSEELGVVHETIPESPEYTMAESRTWNPNGDHGATACPASPEEPVEKKQRKRLSFGLFQTSRRSSGSIRSSRRSVSSDLSSMWSAIAKDFSTKPLDGQKSRNSISAATLASSDENKELTPTKSQAPNLSKLTRSKSVIASLGLKMTRKTTQPSSLPSSPTTPVRRPTFRIVENRENLIQEVRGIEDDESRRLTELAFMDF